VDVDAGVAAGQAFLRAGQLDPCGDLFLGAVAPQPGAGRALGRRLGELGDPRAERGKRTLEVFEALALDARVRADGEGPDGYGLRTVGRSVGPSVG
jgi:hypothetical protein